MQSSSLDKKQCLLQFNSRWTLQLINGISNVLQKLLKYFNGTTIFVSFTELFPLPRFPPGIKTLWWRRSDVSLYVPVTSQVRLKWNTQWRLSGTSSRRLIGMSWWRPISTSPRRLKQVSNETPNDVSVVRYQDVSVVRIHDVPSARLDDISTTSLVSPK